MWKIKQAFYAIENNFHGNIQMIYQKYFIGSKILFLVLTFLFYPESSDEFLVVVKILCSDTYLGLCKCDHVIWNPLASLCSNTPYICTHLYRSVYKQLFQSSGIFSEKSPPNANIKHSHSSYVLPWYLFHTLITVL